MDCQLQLIDYAKTGYFSSLVLDYLNDDPKLKPFYRYSSVHPDFGQAIDARRSFATDRDLLVSELKQQYREVETPEIVTYNIHRLSDENTFTVCTAHQPNLFTGYLYFVYKILQTVRLAEQLTQQYPSCHFVPVYYMGSEDNDLDELGKVNLNGETIKWNTAQQGAVGRMRTEGLEPLITEIEKSLGVSDHARELVALLKRCYLGQADVQMATLHLVNTLFGRYGLVVIIADTPGFKKAILPVLEAELFEQASFPLVNKTIEGLSIHYHAQAHPREINLFYLRDQLRERIVHEEGEWRVLNTDIRFTREELELELREHPGRFSPNVILRGILQESILPNIAFIGGGGELSYWMELKSVFDHFDVPYPVLLLRNSFLWVEQKAAQRLGKTALEPAALFQDTAQLIADFVKKHTKQSLVLKDEYSHMEKLYDELLKKAALVDVTLEASVMAERKRALRSIGKLEHKFLRAEKKKFSWQEKLIREVKSALFPRGTLQERTENLMPYYARYGEAFIDTIYNHLDPTCNQFGILIET